MVDVGKKEEEAGEQVFQRIGCQQRGFCSSMELWNRQGAMGARLGLGSAVQYMGWDQEKSPSFCCALRCYMVAGGSFRTAPCHSSPLPLMCPMQHSHTCAALGWEAPCPHVEEGG